ncbi:hypothetical protein QWY86_11175 [Pedobacter aquatilis]|uniref:hypothetical protein n=1 Tax=Pedobacter aquatilis TaxID=351343 RepID=UPI0025B59DEB|nr:hypothetical protein [Pedobacter aquatilis]MDN3587233.1 hypothetical protein [Pedobacter aquatilis]
MKNLLFLILFLSFGAKAQYEILPFGDVIRTPIKEKKYTDVEGTPYLIEKWSKGKVTLKNGKRYQYDSLRYDLMDDKLVFVDAGKMMHFAEPVAEFEINNPKNGSTLIFKNGFPAVDALNSSSFFQIICNGKIGLYKKFNKSITESKQYGSAVVNKTFNTTYSYYSYKNGIFSKIVPNKKSIFALFEDKENQLNEYLKNHKPDYKNDSDLEQIFNYLNK